MTDLNLLRERKPQRFNLTDWAIRLGVALIFITVGYDKFSDDPLSEWVKIFHQIGWGEWFRYATGIIEMGGGVALLIPRTALLGYGLLAGAMLGAALIHLFVLRDRVLSVVPAILCGGLIALACHRHSEGH